MIVSGGAGVHGVVAGTLRGPTLLTGGGFGPEASVVAVVVRLAAAIIVLREVVRRRLTEPPLWSADLMGGAAHS